MAGLGAQPPAPLLGQVEVVDARLAAGRGEEFSAARIRERQAVDFGMDDGFYLPMSHRANDPLETSGVDMATVDTAVPDSNKGYQMLRAMGWTEGVGLGRKEDGIREPVRGGVEAGLRLGVGKAEEDSFYTAAENIVRKRLEVEVQAEEDEARARRREEQVLREERIRADVAVAQRNLFCETCHKQYKTAAELETHLSSYDHHHKKRLMEMKADTAERTRHERGRREKRRAEKEAAKLQERIQRAHQARTAPAGAELSSAPAPPLPDEQSPPPPPPDVDPDPLLDDVPPPPPPPPDDMPHARRAPADTHAPAVGARTGWDSPAPPPPPPPPADRVGRPAGRAAQGGAAPNEAQLGAVGGADRVVLGLGVAAPQSAPLQFNMGGGRGFGRGAAAMGVFKFAGALSRGGGSGGRLKPAAAAFQVESDDDA